MASDIKMKSAERFLVEGRLRERPQRPATSAATLTRAATAGMAPLQGLPPHAGEASTSFLGRQCLSDYTILIWAEELAMR